MASTLDATLPRVTEVSISESLGGPSVQRAETDTSGRVAGDYIIRFRQPDGMTSSMGYQVRFVVHRRYGKTKAAELGSNYDTIANDWVDITDSGLPGDWDTWERANIGASQGEYVEAMNLNGIQMGDEFIRYEYHLMIRVYNNVTNRHGNSFTVTNPISLCRAAKLNGYLMRYWNGIHFCFNLDYDGDGTFNVESMLYDRVELLKSPMKNIPQTTVTTRTSSTYPRPPQGSERAIRCTIAPNYLTRDGAYRLFDGARPKSTIAYYETSDGVRTYARKVPDQYTYLYSEITDTPRVTLSQYKSGGMLQVRMYKSVEGASYENPSIEVWYNKGGVWIKINPFESSASANVTSLNSSVARSNFYPPLNSTIRITAKLTEGGVQKSTTFEFDSVDTKGLFVLSLLNSATTEATLYANPSFTRSRDVGSSIRQVFGKSMPVVSFSGSTIRKLVLKGDLIRSMSSNEVSATGYSDTYATDADWESVAGVYSRMLLRTPKGEMFTVVVNSIDLDYSNDDVVGLTATFTEVL